MKPIALLLTILALTGCATQSALKTAEPTTDLSLDVQWVRNSAEYRAACLQTFRLASDALRGITRDLAPGPWAVAIDADETLISNSLYQKEMLEVGGDYDRETWGAWVARREAPPMPGAMDFLATVRELGGHIAVVTNRPDELCDDTRQNLRDNDMPFDVMLCRQGGERDKRPRWRSIELGEATPELPPVEIVMWLGDNIGDFPDLDQEMRFGPEEGYGEFGARYFILPNPMYGSWEDNPQD